MFCGRVPMRTCSVVALPPRSTLIAASLPGVSAATAASFAKAGKLKARQLAWLPEEK